jgi:PIN domain nuclease of toxin-antitoxin system
VRFLLDTHVLLWLLGASDRVSSQSRAVLADTQNAVLVSVVSVWEIVIKVGLGKLQAPPDVGSWLPPRLESTHFTSLRVELGHVLGVEKLPHYHTDPFDRLLIAQAIAEDLTLVTADQKIQRYDVRVLRC